MIAADATGRNRTRRWLPFVAVLAGFVLLGLVVNGSTSGGPPLDPGSTGADGAKALALLLGQVGPGVDVVSQVPAAGHAGIALVLKDQLGKDGDRQLDAWVRSGGTLVAADPDLVGQYVAPLTLPANQGVETESGPTGIDCDLPALAGVHTIDPSDGLALQVPMAATACFVTAGGGAFLEVEPWGQGQLVLLGGADLWANANLGTDDNSVLAADLLVPRPGGPKVQWIVGLSAGNGHRSLAQLLPDRVVEALAMLGVALLLLALWRGRRLGRAVVETPPVQVPGSELVVAVGNILHKGEHRSDAAAVLRSTLRRDLATRLAIAPDAAAETVATVVSERTGLDPALVLATVAGVTPATDAALVELAANTDAIRQALTHPEREAARAT